MISVSTFQRQCREGYDLHRKHGGTQRRGQFNFNMLAQLRPDLAEKVRAAEIDPFYADHAEPAAAHEVHAAFWRFLTENWMTR